MAKQNNVIAVTMSGVVNVTESVVVDDEKALGLFRRILDDLHSDGKRPRATRRRRRRGRRANTAESTSSGMPEATASLSPGAKTAAIDDRNGQSKNVG